MRFLFYFGFLLCAMLSAQDGPLEGAGGRATSSSEGSLPETVEHCVGLVLGGCDEEDSRVPVGPRSPVCAPQLPVDFFFETLYWEVQQCDFLHIEVPYSFLVNRPGIEVRFTRTNTGERVSVVDASNVDREVSIGFVADGSNKNYVMLNDEMRYVPQIKTLYTMFLRREAERLLWGESERQEALEGLLRSPEVYQLYQKTGSMTGGYSGALGKKNMPVAPKEVRKMIEVGFALGEGCDVMGGVSPYHGQQPIGSAVGARGELRAEAREFIPRRAQDGSRVSWHEHALTPYPKAPNPPAYSDIEVAPPPSYCHAIVSSSTELDDTAFAPPPPSTPQPPPPPPPPPAYGDTEVAPPPYIPQSPPPLSAYPPLPE